MDFKPPKELLRLSKEAIETFENYWKQLNLQEDLDRLHSLEERSKDPHLWDDPEKARLVTQKKNELSIKIEPWLELKKELFDFPDLIELTLDEVGEQGAQSLNEDFQNILEKLENLQIEGALNGKDDGRNAFINIHPGAGGTESQDWAEMLLRMFTRYLEKRGYKSELIDVQEGETAGIKNATIYIQGDKAFGYLKSESGVHRLVRISPFDSNKRRHTSFCFCLRNS
jgi:peptide chain release factor 2